MPKGDTIKEVGIGGIDHVTPRISLKGTFGISTRLPEAGLHQSSTKAKLTTGSVLEVSPRR